MSLPVTRRNFLRLQSALRDALPSLKDAAEAEDVRNKLKLASGYPAETVQRGIYENARAALGIDGPARDNA